MVDQLRDKLVRARERFAELAARGAALAIEETTTTTGSTLEVARYNAVAVEALFTAAGRSVGRLLRSNPPVLGIGLHLHAQSDFAAFCHAVMKSADDRVVTRRGPSPRDQSHVFVTWPSAGVSTRTVTHAVDEAMAMIDAWLDELHSAASEPKKIEEVWLTQREAAELGNISERTVQRWLKAGKLVPGPRGKLERAEFLAKLPHLQQRQARPGSVRPRRRKKPAGEDDRSTT